MRADRHRHVHAAGRAAQEHLQDQAGPAGHEGSASPVPQRPVDHEQPGEDIRGPQDHPARQAQGGPDRPHSEPEDRGPRRDGDCQVRPAAQHGFEHVEQRFRRIMTLHVQHHQVIAGRDGEPGPGQSRSSPHPRSSPASHRPRPPRPTRYHQSLRPPGGHPARPRRSLPRIGSGPPAPASAADNQPGSALSRNGSPRQWQGSRLEILRVALGNRRDALVGGPHLGPSPPTGSRRWRRGRFTRRDAR